MKSFALVMTDNILYKNSFVNKLVLQNSKSIKLIIELNFRHPSSNKKKHLERYIQLLGIKGMIYISGLMLKNCFQKFILAAFSKNGYSIKQIAKKNNIKYVKVQNINSKKTIRLLEQEKVCYLLNSGNQIYRGDILKKYENKILNRHTSLLPSYGGIYPIFWQLLNEYKDGGVTLHWVTSQIDKGSPAYQEKIRISPKKSLFNLYEEAFKISLKLCNQAISDLNKGLIKTIDTDIKPSYYSWPNKVDIRKFKKKGLRIV